MKSPDDAENWFYEFLIAKYGVWIVGLLAVVWGFWRLWKDRDDIVDLLKTVRTLRDVLHVKTNPNKINILFAALNNDREDEIKGLFSAEFVDMDPLQPLSVGMKIKSEEDAIALLQRSRGQVLIWGDVLRKDNHSVPRLKMTTSYGSFHLNKGQKYLVNSVTLDLPELFWRDLFDVVTFLISIQYSEFKDTEGRYLADLLAPYINKVRRMLEPGRGPVQEERRTDLYLVLAYALRLYGAQVGRIGPINDAVKYYTIAISSPEMKRDQCRLSRAQDGLGNALLRLAEMEKSPNLITEAIRRYELALEGCDKARDPITWGKIQNNLGHAHFVSYDLGANTLGLESALPALIKALEVRTPEGFPREWSTTMNNIGNVYAKMGKSAGKSEYLRKAIEAYEAALKVRTRKKYPLYWARTLNNLANVHRELGSLNNNIGHAKSAIRCYRQSLKVTEKRTMDWAITKRNLGKTLRVLGDLKQSRRLYIKAVRDIGQASEVFDALGNEKFANECRESITELTKKTE